ncbi:Lrp/AsnC ligand binding domain-containing protein [Candidatus Woesearchaeota archaeon]|nr:Lrp/AsnC ligand binding domain-containing protein [Candidatus Woesearchaeota archaeon]MBL7051370.1 Lrp/AsnC ligand binding domain-containing protein [Candidatus Woesearchaeota archaeon]
MLAYLLISVTENEQKVVDKILELPEIKEAHILFGEWDVIAKVNMDSPEGLSAFVMDKIRPIKEIKLTSTMIVAK